MADRERALNIVCAKCYRFPCLVVFFRATYAILSRESNMVSSLYLSMAMFC